MTLKSLRTDLHARAMDEIVLCQQLAPAESPGIDLLKAFAAHDPAQVFAVLERKWRNDPQLIRQHDFFNPAPDKRVTPQRPKICRKLEVPEITTSLSSPS